LLERVEPVALLEFEFGGGDRQQRPRTTSRSAS